MKKKEGTTKKKTTRTKKEKADFNPFIKTTLYEMMMKKIPYIKELFEEYNDIEPIPADKWKMIDNLICEVGYSAALEPETSETFMGWRTEPLKRATYTLTNKVREQQTRKFVLSFISRITEGDDENNIYCCYMIYMHLNSMLGENCKNK